VLDKLIADVAVVCLLKWGDGRRQRCCTLIGIRAVPLHFCRLGMALQRWMSPRYAPGARLLYTLSNPEKPTTLTPCPEYKSLIYRLLLRCVQQRPQAVHMQPCFAPSHDRM